jgi:hypothetical protein
MNKVILKQRSKKQDKTKKITQQVIQNKLLRYFQHHIGEENRISGEEVFQAVMNVNSSQVDSFARFYWFNRIECVMRKLRREDKCFIIKKEKHYFVLKAHEECTYYGKICHNTIDKIEKAVIRAEDWVKNEKWRNMEIPQDEDEESDKEESDGAEAPKIQPKKDELDNYKNKLKTKVIKLWEEKK